MKSPAFPVNPGSLGLSGNIGLIVRHWYNSNRSFCYGGNIDGIGYGKSIHEF
jgi:hypothetical protein